MLAPAESAPKRPSPLPVPSALLLAELGPAVMADDPCEAAFGRADPTAPRKYYRARYYDPKIGRFISEGPIGFSGGINFFAYVFNDPVNRTDPSGQAVVQVPPLPPPPNPTSFWQQFFWHFFSQTRTMSIHWGRLEKFHGCTKSASERDWRVSHLRHHEPGYDERELRSRPPATQQFQSLGIRAEAVSSVSPV